MEMSTAYMTETVEYLETQGFRRTTTPLTKERDGVVIYEGERHELVVGQADTEFLALEVFRYPDGTERYFLELVAFHGMMSYPFELDSWKHRPDRVEFKYYAPADTGVGLSFILSLPRPAAS